MRVEASHGLRRTPPPLFRLTMHSQACFALAVLCILASARAQSVNCWGTDPGCVSTVKRFTRLRTHTIFSVQNSAPAAATTTLLSAVHFPNVDGQPPGAAALLRWFDYT